MTRALHALSLALGDLASRRVLRVLAQSLALTLLLFLIAGGALVFAGSWALDHWDWLDGTGLDLASAMLVVVLIAGRSLLFRADAIAAVGPLADASFAADESRKYHAAATRDDNVG